MSWGFRFWFKLALGIWALLFFVLIVPFAQLHKWKVGTLPVAEGTLSNHRLFEVERRKPRRIEQYVKVTLEFDRPGGNGQVPGQVHCKHDNVTIGPAGRAESFVTRVELAVRTDSCHGYFFLPLDVPSLGEWVWLFLFV